jgi:RNA polymerase sigma-70 factor (ECF subfamily)
MSRRPDMDELLRVVRRNVAGELRRRGAVGRSVEQEIDDLAQAANLAIFVDGGALSTWDPARGLDLHDFIALVARREVDSVLRSRRRNPWTEAPVDDDTLDLSQSPGPGLETLTNARRKLWTVVARLRERTSPRAFQIFEMIFLQGRSPRAVAAALGLEVSTVYAVKSHLCAAARAIHAEIESSAT